MVTGPAGAGKTALADAAADLAAARGMPVLRATATGMDSGYLIWNRLLGAEGAGGLAADAGQRDIEGAAAAIARGGPRLLIVDDLDKAGTAAVAFLAVLASRLGSGRTALVVTARDGVGFGQQVRLGSLSEPELAVLMPDLPDEAVHAVWLASGGWPGAALGLAGELAGLEPLPRSAADLVAHLALTVPSRAPFLDLDVGLLRLLEAAAGGALPPATRARVLARLARELLGDASAAPRRGALINEAESLARQSASPAVIADVLDCRLHALWDPAAARERLSTASEIVEQARRAGDAVLEGRGLFWRFVALAELGDLGAAEAALTAYARAGELAGDAEAAVVVLARQSMLATVRGRFDAAGALAAQVAVQARRVGLADADRLVGTLRAAIAAQRGEFASLVDPLQDLARRLPGHFFEANAARALAESGRGTEAGLELARILPAVLARAGAGPRWLAVVADLAIVAARGDQPAPAQALYEALLPYQGRLVVWGGANTITGPVDDYLGRLAARLGEADRAVRHLNHAAAMEERAGALPWLASTLLARADALSTRADTGDRSLAEDDLARARLIAQRLGMKGILTALAPPSDTWRLTRDGTDWILEAGPETARLRDTRGLRYLRTLLAAPGQEIPALDLVAQGAGLRVPAGPPILDDTARASYRERLESLEEQLDAADRAGAVERATAVHAERATVLAELRRASGLGGRPRVHSGEAERARVNATRALWATVERVESAAPLAGAHLRTSLRTGGFPRYQPAPGGPARWRV